MNHNLEPAFSTSTTELNPRTALEEAFEAAKSSASNVPEAQPQDDLGYLEDQFQTPTVDNDEQRLDPAERHISPFADKLNHFSESISKVANYFEKRSINNDHSEALVINDQRDKDAQEAAYNSYAENIQVTAAREKDEHRQEQIEKAKSILRRIGTVGITTLGLGIIGTEYAVKSSASVAKNAGEFSAKTAQNAVEFGLKVAETTEKKYQDTKRSFIDRARQAIANKQERHARNEEVAKERSLEIAAQRKARVDSLKSKANETLENIQVKKRAIGSTAIKFYAKSRNAGQGAIDGARAGWAKPHSA